ncbi:MAG: DUF86 domain-containing protein [Acidimicrobiia bacterium]|nr:DUF86 domain-containing protein [bacterium]MXZ30944.1 DUF86 domain-containing protein [Acidimicrobiia bacterium]MYB23816.1 DUF86 domain-containing protein [Acidimicrobiia bacterium]MYE67423.1 DUF86 domain-containing protein [Acidimicrobiia bacterium]MYJ13146.1 DUF86 domain-containing protein [Acidimicrobiia bacterium]
MSERRWDLYVRDMIECCTKVEEYTAGLDHDTFFATDAINDAVLWNLAILGEAANSVAESIRNAHPEIPWREITGMRNRLVHGYLRIDDNTLWEVICEGIPELLPQLRELIGEAGDAGS